ncbi:MAG TPA: histidine kinase [Gemmatirosa sp.]|nr:histidine kinase [Gemmatirosa sp.]
MSPLPAAAATRGAPRARRRWSPERAPAWVWAVGLWAVPVLVTVAQPYVRAMLAGRPVRLVTALAQELAFWAFWIVVTPLIAWLVRRVRPAPGRWGRALPLHLGAAVVLSVAAQLYYGVLRRLDGTPVPPEYATLGASIRSILLDRWLGIGMLLYAVVAGAVVAVDMTRGYHERDQRAAERETELEAQLARAQLDALRAQLNPHFLFNALNSVAMLVRAGARGEAVHALAELAELLRRALYGPSTPEVSLREELGFVERYLGVERMRFQDRLQVTVDVAPDALDAAVPNLLLQPLVENALKHGIAPRAAGGRVTVRARVDGGVLQLEVADDGAGLAATATSGAAGLGLANTRARLDRLYGGAARLHLHAGAQGGAVVRVELPCRSLAAAGSA